MNRSTIEKNVCTAFNHCYNEIFLLIHTYIPVERLARKSLWVCASDAQVCLESLVDILYREIFRICKRVNSRLWLSEQ